MNQEETEWIPHDGGECPIPWAGADEYEFMQNKSELAHFRGPFKPGCPASGFLWDVITAWRLTDRWIPVIDGKMPKEIEGAQLGEWEFKYRDGIYAVASCSSASCHFKHFNYRLDVVAVRIVKRAQLVLEEATYCKFCDYHVDNPEGIVGEVCCENCNEH